MSYTIARTNITIFEPFCPFCDYISYFWTCFDTFIHKCVIHVIILLRYITLQCIMYRINDFIIYTTAILLLCCCGIDVSVFKCLYLIVNGNELIHAVMVCVMEVYCVYVSVSPFFITLQVIND